ncbi:growth-blocking peptide, long form [Bicyclus anynana]|uniref:Growth-blocking peptide, long form n=1 Tax=Bicyclus anynana TaxID=110368 RepID=A0A6J1P152_BICAN|nr:growth-blocking peptide, long form [Bicyclus anynana]
MKKIIFIYCSLNLLLLFQVTNGGLAKNFFGKIHDTAHEIHDDIHNLFHRNEDANRRVPNTATNTVSRDETSEPVFVFATTSEPKPISSFNSGQPTKVEDVSVDSSFVFATSSTTEINLQQKPGTAKSNSTTDVKDGRENFAGGCTPGRKRTEDGRCEVPF